MSRRPAVLLLLLALVSALWHPLCPCRAPSSSANASESASCCASDEAPTPVDPCGMPPGECECGQGALLARSSPERASVEPTSVELALALPVVTPLRAFALELACAPRLPARTRPTGPPGAARLLPLRI